MRLNTPWQHMTATERQAIVDLVVGGEELVCSTGGLEPFRLPFASSRPLVPTVLIPRHQLLLRRRIPRQLVSNHDGRRPHPLAQQRTQQRLLDHAQAERAAEVQPDRVADDLRALNWPPASRERTDVIIPSHYPLPQAGQPPLDGAVSARTHPGRRPSADPVVEP